MNTTHIPTLRRMATGLGLAALSAAATLSIGAGTAAADRAVCDCAEGKHAPHNTVPGLRDDFNPQPEPPGRDHRGVPDLRDDFNPQPEPPGRHDDTVLTNGGFPGLTTNHSLVIARGRRSGDH